MIDRIMRNLTRTVPEAPKPTPKPAKSWHTMTVGRVLVWKHRGVPNMKGDYRVVTQIDSLGCTLLDPGSMETYRWEDPDFLQVYNKVHAREGAKLKKEWGLS